MAKESFVKLVTGYLNGEITPEEVEILLSDSQDELKKFNILKEFAEHNESFHHAMVEENLQKTLNSLGLPAYVPPVEVPKGRAIFYLFRKARFAAAVLLILCAGGVWWISRRSGASSAPVLATLSEKHNSKGTKSVIQLSDGSKIWLNADSKLKYPEVFKGDTREVYLNGEAFFDVAKSTGHPFILHLASGTIQVLGTSFNVRAYDNERVVETSVATGKIAFIPKYKTSHRKQDTVYLVPDHKACYAWDREELRTGATSSKEDKAWTEGKLIFRGLTMEQIAVELERNFGKRVVFVDNAPKEFVFTGSFENNTLDEIMYYLTRTKSFSYKITNTELLIGASASQLTH